MDPTVFGSCKSTPEMVEALLLYSADPLVRVDAGDFPGRALLRCALCLPEASSNRWTGFDQRVSLIHIAILRGCLRMLRTVLPLVRDVHFSPLTCVKGMQPTSLLEPLKGEPLAEPPRKPGGVRPQVLSAVQSSKVIQDRATARLLKAPVSEGQLCDPVGFCTTEGWSPAGLALLLHTIDPDRKVHPIELVAAFSESGMLKNSRTEIFTEILATGKSLLEDQPDAPSVMLPQRFPDVSDTLTMKIVEQFAKLCKGEKTEESCSRIISTTLCVACEQNRFNVVKYLLDTGLADARCSFLRPVECRPIHLATRNGFSKLAQFLLEHKADPLELDESGTMPLQKLAKKYEGQIAELKARVSELEAELARKPNPRSP